MHVYEIRPRPDKRGVDLISDADCRMSVHGVGIVATFISLTVSAYAANPFLDAKDDKPVSANFRGRVWLPHANQAPDDAESRSRNT